MSERITTYQDLRVYQEACELDRTVFEISAQFPAEEMFSLTDRVRRSARSIGGSIAEAWAKRRDPAGFVDRLTDADGELQATRHWLGRSLACSYLKPDEHQELEARCDSIGRKLGTMIRDAESFGGKADPARATGQGRPEYRRPDTRAAAPPRSSPQPADDPRPPAAVRPAPFRPGRDTR